MPSIVVYGDNEFAVTILDSPIYESSVVEYNAYVETLADISKMLEDLKGIDFYTLHNEPLGEWLVYEISY